MNRRLATIAALAATFVIASAIPTVHALPVSGSLYTMVDGRLTNLSWIASPGAASYEVSVNGTPTARIPDGSRIDVSLGLPLGPKDRVEVVAIDATGMRAEPEPATYWSNDYVRYQGATVYFTDSSARLDATDRKKLQAFATFIEQHGFTEVMVIGHHAGSAPSLTGYSVGQARARSVKAALSPQVDATVTGSSWGNSWPAASNASAAGRAANQRVELYFR